MAYKLVVVGCILHTHTQPFQNLYTPNFLVLDKQFVQEICTETAHGLYRYGVGGVYVVLYSYTSHLDTKKWNFSPKFVKKLLKLSSKVVDSNYL